MYYKTKNSASLVCFDTCFMYDIGEVSDRRCTYPCTKITKSVDIMNKLLYYFPTNAMKSIYNCFIVPYLNYFFYKERTKENVYSAKYRKYNTKNNFVR